MNEPTKQTRVEKLLLEAARTFNSTLEYEELNELVLKLVIGAVECEAAVIVRHDPDESDTRMRYMHCRDCRMDFAKRKPGAGIIGWVIEHGESLIENDPANNPLIDHEAARQQSIELRSLIALPLIGHGRLIGAVEAINKIGGGFTDADLDILTGLNHQIAVAVANTHLYRQVKREALEKNLLYETGKKLSEKLSLEEVLAAILDSLKQVVSYESGGVFLCDDRGVDLNAIYSVGYAPGSESSLHMKCDQGLVGAAATTGEEVIVPDVKADPRYVQANPNTRSEIVVPIKVSDRVIGVINLESTELNAYDQNDLSLITAFASQAGISIERAMLHESNLEAKQLEAQLNVARETQRTFLPDHDPVVPGYDITGQNTPSGQVGGDYYDFISIVDSHLGIPIADVSGKGMPAALIMASFRASLIAEIRNNYSIRTIAEKVNSLLCESLEPGNYVTGVYGVLDSTNHIFTFSNFGHNPPIWLRQNGDVELLTEGGLVLGVTGKTVFEERALMMQPGEIIVMYTDGVTEVFDDSGREFGQEGLVEVVRSNRSRPSTEITEAINQAVSEHAASNHVFDDITLVVIKRNPA